MKTNRAVSQKENELRKSRLDIQCKTNTEKRTSREEKEMWIYRRQSNIDLRNIVSNINTEG